MSDETRDGVTQGGRSTTSKRPLKDVVDPELGINVVDLGLVYGIHVDDENVATIDMTLTSAACPLTDVIEDQARAGAAAPGPAAAWSATSGSTGSGCRRGAPTRSPTRAATSCGRSASTSDPGRPARENGCGAGMLWQAARP